MNQTIVQKISDNVKYNLHDFLTFLWLLSKQYSSCYYSNIP